MYLLKQSPYIEKRLKSIWYIIYIFKKFLENHLENSDLYGTFSMKSERTRKLYAYQKISPVWAPCLWHVKTSGIIEVNSSGQKHPIFLKRIDFDRCEVFSSSDRKLRGKTGFVSSDLILECQSNEIKEKRMFDGKNTP